MSIKQWKKDQGPPPEWHDWVEELFSPSLNLEREAIMEGVNKDSAVKSKIKRISVLDPETVREVYEKVHMMSMMNDEMKTSGLKKTTISSELKTADISSTSKVEKSKKTVEVDLDESCVWDSDEISVLRKVFKQVKEENMKLRVKNKEIEKRNMQLEMKYNSLVKELEEKNFKLTEVVKANSRLKIHCENLQKELDETNVRMTAMEQIFKEINEEKGKMVKDVHELRLTADKERMEKNAIQLKLETIQHQIASEKIALEESIKIQCRDQIANLEKNVIDLTKELNKEIKAHKTTKRGLDHLRNHFASLPLSHIVPPNAVSSDQISQFQY
ncbi:major antigen-like [Saccostrea echinata]|uniref:major antigen-like n=1 Tax=Saccostrea echinata TaxID=191078 RepID=UPI002A82A320|nr:major antigen-like [Saccostrea echinata]